MDTNNKILTLQGQEEQRLNIHYEINISEPPLGEGGTGVVRRAIMIDDSTSSRRPVAIKFLFNDLSETSIERSRREANIRIQHENLIEMIGFMQIGSADLYGKGSVRYHVISELLNGVMLLDMLNGEVTDETYRKYPKIYAFYELLVQDRDAFALKIARCVISGIMALHDNGYIHRDIDPSNVMITEEGKVKLIDLGIAKKMIGVNTSTERHMTNVGQFVGKAAYAAPELVRGDVSNQNATTDIYSIGIMLFQIVTGHLPFQGTIQEMLDMQIKEPIPLKCIADKEIRNIIKKATEKNQKNRYQSAAEFRAAIDNIGGSPNHITENIYDSGYSDFIDSHLWTIVGVLGGVGVAIGVIIGLIV